MNFKTSLLYENVFIEISMEIQLPVTIDLGSIA